MSFLLSIYRNTAMLRIIAVLWWVCILVGNVRDPHISGDFEASGALLIATVIASASVWFWKNDSRVCIEGACAILAVGGLGLVLDLNLLSLLGLVLIAFATGLIRAHVGFDNLGKVWLEMLKPSETATAGSSARPANPSAPAQAPAAKEADRYGHIARPARYTFADIVGMGETKRRLRAAAADILAGGKDVRNGILAFGDPGNGKSLLAEAIAGELKVPFLSIAFGDVVSKWIGEAPQNIKAVFDAARGLKNGGVLFIDEVDAFLKSRGADGVGAHSGDRDMTNVMLTEIVALRGSKIILIAATNLRDDLDAAGIREGRFDFQIEIPPPDLEAREALLRRGVLQSFADVDVTTIASLARRWEGFSAARLTALGKQLAEMRRDGSIGDGDPFNVEIGMRAMRLLQGRRGRLPERVKPIDAIVMPAASRDALKQLAFRLQNVEDLEKLNSNTPTAVIFWGPPGTGKTASAMALAKASGYAFLPITGAEIMARPTAWDQIVREARDIRPCVLFIDEADDVLRDRRQSHVAPLTNKILSTLDGGTGRTADILYVAATNHYDMLDPAVVRGGRFEFKVAFDVPSMQDMSIYVNQALLRHAAAGYVIPEPVIGLLQASLTRRSIADADAIVQTMIDQAGMRRLREGTLDVREEDVEAAVNALRGMHER
ncbi:AAA family ATPase [Paraburkholderia sp. C35]|uniref:AAA family ATPase n=1 Tax=Paraburkholderia sp. C35 TaxID=2126993 RepID=UPI0013A5606E|nr:AAA family ATPase [Paraburkholderia sp. C35]